MADLIVQGYTVEISILPSGYRASVPAAGVEIERADLGELVQAVEVALACWADAA